MSTYKEQDIENLLAHLREGIASDSVLALADDIRVDCEGAGDGESVWMHPVLPGARYGKDDKVIYDPFDTLPGRSLKSSSGAADEPPAPRSRRSTCPWATCRERRRSFPT